MLEKFHTQKYKIKDLVKEKELNERLKLNYNLNNEFDLLKLAIIDKAVQQKEYFEKAYETCRNELFDMWNHLSFYEKNDLILLEVNKEIDSLSHFIVNETRIFIPFFNEMLNSLYATETAIFDKKQFFGLYYDFVEMMEPIENYGLLPYANGFTNANLIYSDDKNVILFNEDLNVFYLINENFKRIPILDIINIDRIDFDEISQVILNDNETELIEYLIRQQYVSRRLIRQYTKEKRKLEKKKKKERKK